MACSAHSYVRGSTLKFYEWLGSSTARSLPQGPPIWICGDCHLGNLGPVADAKGRVKIAIRDLDQTVIGNPAHDLIRLGLSLATAIRGSDLPGVTTALMLEQMMEGYEGALANPGKNPRKSAAPASVQRVLKRALKRRWHHLAEERIEDVSPEIPMGKRFWPVTGAEKKEIQRIFKLPEVRDLITSLKDRSKHDEVEVVDAAYWMKGCSSLGRLRFAVLLGIAKRRQIVKAFVWSTSRRPFRPEHLIPLKRLCPGTMQSASSRARENYRLSSDSVCWRDTSRGRQPSFVNCSPKTSNWKWINSRAKRR